MKMRKKITLLVKAYPEKSKRHGSSICTAGITEDGEWIRIYPLDLEYYRNHKGILTKWNIIEGEIREASEKLNRKESHKISEHSIVLISEDLANISRKSKKQKGIIWQKRTNFLKPMLNTGMNQLKQLNNQDHTSIGFIKPRKFEFYFRKPLSEVKIVKGDRSQKKLFGGRKIEPDEIEKIFAYKFYCEDIECSCNKLKKPHDKICEDWELIESFRSWKKTYPDPKELQSKLLDKYSFKNHDLYFIVGTTSLFGTWVIIGLYYCPKSPKGNLESFF